VGKLYTAHFTEKDGLDDDYTWEIIHNPEEIEERWRVGIWVSKSSQKEEPGGWFVVGRGVFDGGEITHEQLREIRDYLNEMELE
jgi:hypothetical protein